MATPCSSCDKKSVTEIYYQPRNLFGVGFKLINNSINNNSQTKKRKMATYLTQEGYNKKMEELAALEAQRPAIKHAIAEARDKGDLSENAEYDAAKEAQGMLEMKISKIKELIATARIIDDSKLNTDEVQILNKVTIRNTANGATMSYWIVTENEANLREHKIASNTPIAQGLIGHKVGDIVQVKAPAGVINFEIMKIEI
jgi:transcription elongation factor GreA